MRCFVVAETEDEDDESRVEDEGTKRSSWTRSTLVTRIASIVVVVLESVQLM
jgi:hypothetical protein